jgi:hypothetical protein
MQKICTYHIQVRGQVEEKELNKMSPLEMRVSQVDRATTLFQTSTDQSGLVGLIRHLHGQGFVLLSIIRKVML